MSNLFEKIEKTVHILAEDNDKLRDCVKLMQSILNHGDFVAETYNEGVLVKALDIAGYPVEYSSNRDCAKDYMLFLEEKHKEVVKDHEELQEAIAKIKDPQPIMD